MTGNKLVNVTKPWFSYLWDGGFRWNTVIHIKQYSQLHSWLGICDIQMAIHNWHYTALVTGILSVNLDLVNQLFVLFFWAGSMYLWLSWDWLCRPSWPWIHRDPNLPLPPKCTTMTDSGNILFCSSQLSWSERRLAPGLQPASVGWTQSFCWVGSCDIKSPGKGKQMQREQFLRITLSSPGLRLQTSAGTWVWYTKSSESP